MATGVAVNTGDLITAAKMNLKQEDGTALANLGVLDQSGAGAQDLRFVCSENLTANRNLTITVNDAARTIDLGGNLTLAAALTTATAAITLTANAAGSSVTLPETGTLATLAGTETLTNKTITAATLSGTFPGTPTFSGATITFTGTAIALTGGAAFNLGTTDAFALNLQAGGANRLGISNTIGQFTVYQTTANYTLSFSDPAAARTITFGDPGGADNIAYLAATQTFTNKTYSGGTLSGTLAGTPTLSGATITLIGGTLNLTAGAAYTIGTTDAFNVIVKANNANRFAVSSTIGQLVVYQTTGNYTLSFSDPAAGRTLTIPDPLGADTFVFASMTQTLTGKTISLSGDLTFSAALDIEIQAATAVALEVNASAQAYLAIDTRIATDGVIAFTWDLANPTFASAAGSAFQMHRINAFTVNLTGGVGVTAMNGMGMEFQAITLAAAGATTVTTASTLFLRPLTAGANITITNSRMIDTSVAGCFLTAAGVWTDASSEEVKEAIRKADLRRIPALLEALDVYSYRRKDSSDNGEERFGLIAERAPSFLRVQDKGTSANYMAGFALAALKWLQRENQGLKKRLSKLEQRMAAS